MDAAKQREITNWDYILRNEYDWLRACCMPRSWYLGAGTCPESALYTFSKADISFNSEMG